MDEPKSLDSLFKEKLFRIPDYQRGYAWGSEQLAAFWEDLINLSDGRSHYTGVLTLNAISSSEVQPREKEFWLVDDHSYRLYNIVDGQQRLTTFMLFLQAMIELLRNLPENKDKQDSAIYLTDTLSITDVEERFLFKVKPPENTFRTYKFGYTKDNPSDRYLRHKILGEQGSGDVNETFYTLKLSNGKNYFKEQLSETLGREGSRGIQNLYRKLTKQFLFNEYIINDDFDVFIAFETMNNRGKSLSNLELLKNRLIYLTTLYTDGEVDEAGRKELRDSINDAWKEVYYQLGRNKQKPLNDDDFLRAHWMMYFKYSRKTGQDYIKFLLEEQFSPHRVHSQIVRSVELQDAEEQTSEYDLEVDEENEPLEEDSGIKRNIDKLRPDEISNYVSSLKDSAGHWFQTFSPEKSEYCSPEEIQWIQRLNRLRMAYFRPLLMAILKNYDSSDRIEAFKQIERFVFVVFRLTQARSNYGSSEFSNAVRAIDKGEMDLADLAQSLQNRMKFTLTDECTFKIDSFYLLIQQKFENDQGYYDWSGLQYFLYEYELGLLSENRQKKVDWDDLLTTRTDKISIEHIYPQTETQAWAAAFEKVQEQERKMYRNSLGNLLLLSLAINSKLQNDSFAEKKEPRFGPDNSKLRDGYANGSHSEIEVSREKDWGPDEIYKRGLRLIKFMERRWCISFANDEVREKMLFISRKSDIELN